MKGRQIVNVASAVFALSAAIFFGLECYVWVANRRLQPVVEPAQGPQIVFREGKFHPATTQMIREAQELGGISAPTFSGVDVDGHECRLSTLTRDKPVLLYFIEYQCPCCKGAKPYIDRIQDYYGDACTVVGVIDASPELSKAWTRLLRPQFRILPDPDMKIIRDYKATRGTYTVLISPGGRIVKEYPGYSQGMLEEITTNIARMAGIQKRPMPLTPAPKQITSGCIFPGTKLPGDEL